MVSVQLRDGDQESNFSHSYCLNCIEIYNMHILGMTMCCHARCPYATTLPCNLTPLPFTQLHKESFSPPLPVPFNTVLFSSVLFSTECTFICLSRELYEKTPASELGNTVWYVHVRETLYHTM